MDLADYKVIQFRLKVPYVIDDMLFPVPATGKVDDDRLRELLYYQKELGEILNHNK